MAKSAPPHDARGGTHVPGNYGKPDMPISGRHRLPPPAAEPHKPNREARNG